jgi:membrane protein DedA with SNARE-associated domain
MLFLADSLPHLIATFGYAFVGVVVALEGMGIPLPGETALILTAVYAERTHHLNIGLVIAAAIAGAIVGDNIGFWIGREVGYRLVLRFGRYIGLTEKRIKLGQYLFQRRGGIVVFVARFVAVLRTIAPLLAGLNYMPWRRFVVFNAAGGALWATVYGSGAYFLGRGVEHAAKPAAIAIGLAIVIIVILGIVFLRRHEARLEAEAEQALPGPLRPPGRLATRRA